MLFSSISFIYYFLPSLLLIYYITPKKYQNYILLLFSLLFYFLSEPKYIIILLLSCIINYYLSKLIEKNYDKKYLVLACIYNVGQLLYFKYTDFFISSINDLFGLGLVLLRVIMPIGISFFTFQALGYVVDVYLKKHQSAKTLWEFMTYISLFPQLIAGPIVRYRDIADQMKDRSFNQDKFVEGISRFTIGLSKKVLLANVLGEFVNLCISNSIVASWLKVVAFSLQIYFDFSGYSDMAIGLGKMFGFDFLENFNYPFISSSISEFWNRWHISLSSWFKEYVYIPLGGNRVSKAKWFRNVIVVWFLTGFWHGASYNFILWGLYFVVFLVLEKYFLNKYLSKTKVIKHIYVLFVLSISFLIFNTTDLHQLGFELKNLFGLNQTSLIDQSTLYYLNSYKLIFVVSIISATPLLKKVLNKYSVIKKLDVIVYPTLLLLCSAFLIDASFNPFLYFRF